MNERVNESISRSIFNATRTSNGLNKIGTFILDYEYEIEYEYRSIFEFQTSDVSRALALHVGFR